MKKIKILAIACALLMTTNVHAALQSRPGVDAKQRSQVDTYFKLIRDMESSEGVLGLNATFEQNATTKAYEETSTSNNIDSHMCKNTEWGAIAMLSASDYGAGNGKVTSDYNTTTKMYSDKASTTGNKTGVYGLNYGAKCEYVAAGALSAMQHWYNQYLLSAPVRYVDNYKNVTSSSDFSQYIPGDATYETISFGGGGRFVYGSSNSNFIRTTVFQTATYTGDLYHYEASARAIIWVGDGI